MAFSPFSVTPPHIAYTCVGGFVVVFGMFSLFLREKLYIGEACWAFLFGVVIGPHGGGIFDPRRWGPRGSGVGDSEPVNTITLEFTRVVLAIGVFAIGVELPKQYMKKHWKSLFYLLVPVMTWGWFVSAALIFALIPGLSFLSSLAVAACLTPTDPILAAAVVGGKYADKHVPAHLRHLLAAESGCNDGAAFPFLFIALYLSLEKSDAHAVQDFFLITFLYGVALGTLWGSLLGIGFRHLMRFCERKDLIDRKSYVAQYVALALLSVGSTTLLGSDDLLSAFASGTAFAWDGFFNKQTEDSAFSSVIDLLFNIAAFIYIGAWMPFHLFSSVVLTLTTWRLVLLAFLILLLRRLPVVMALYRFIPDIKTIREALFSGHFGPIGVGAVFISTLAVDVLPHPHDPPENQIEMLAATIQPIVAFMVLCSITIHGLSIPFFSLGKRVHSVSRTWSRHASQDLAGPEWATQIRRVVRAEDIVINRDRVEMMERGDSDKIESDMTVQDGVSGSSPEPSPETIDQEEAPQDENPSDGFRKAGEDREWREGPHLIIEHSQGPGEEVDVEVIRNAFTANEETKVSTLFRGTRAGVQKELGKHLQKLRDLPKHIDREIAHAPPETSDNTENQLDQGVRHVEEGIQHVGDVIPPGENAHDEGWRDEAMMDSEGAGPGPSSSMAARPPAAEKKRQKFGKYKPQVFRVSKRRESSRRSGPGGSPGKAATTTPRVPPPSPNPEAAASEELGGGGDDDDRGRAAGPKYAAWLSAVGGVPLPSGSGATHAPHDSISRLRLESLRAESPSRSIRFADESSSPTVGTPPPGTPPTY